MFGKVEESHPCTSEKGILQVMRGDVRSWLLVWYIRTPLELSMMPWLFGRNRSGREVRSALNSGPFFVERVTVIIVQTIQWGRRLADKRRENYT
jgi:hypothetical protein